MSSLRLLLRTLWHFRLTNLALLLGVAVGTAVLTGSLLIGDSLRGSLRTLVEQRLGTVDHVLLAPAFFQDSLAARLQAQPEFQRAFSSVETLISVAGNCTEPQHGTSAARVNVFGRAGVERGTCVISAALAEGLGVEPGDSLVLRTDARSAVPGEVTLGAARDEVAALRLTVKQVAPATSMEGAFSLFASQRPVRNIWVARAELQHALSLEGRGNLLIAGARPGFDAEAGAAALQALLPPAVGVEDYGLRLQAAQDKTIVLESDRLFLSPRLETALQGLDPAPVQVLAYLANTLADERTGRQTPYSMIAGISALPGGALADDDIALNQWIADDLQAQVGDDVRLHYFTRGPDGLLKEQTVRFRLKQITAMAGLGADRSLVPEFKGITDVDALANWSPPRDFNFDLKRIRPLDEDYWKQHAAAPKALISLTAAQRLFGTRFGRLTSARFPPGSESSVRRALLAAVPPADLGLTWRPIRAEQLRAASGSTDFSMLFVGFSFFLIISATLLVVLLMRLAVEQRARQIAVLLAIGFAPRAVKRLILGEGLLVLLAGCALGVAGALGVAELMLYGLRTLWNDAVGTVLLSLHMSALSLLIGLLTSACLGAIAMWKGVGRLEALGVSPLLGGAPLFQALPEQARHRLKHTGVGLVGGAVLLLAAVPVAGLHPAAGFFGAGACLLAGSLLLCRLALASAGAVVAGSRRLLSRGQFALRNAGRNQTRSVLAIGLLAAAALITMATSAMKEELPSGGTGGFSLIGEVDVPVLYDLGTPEGRSYAGLNADNAALWARSQCVSLRASSGEDASCRNLYTPGAPRLLAVPEAFAAADAFVFAEAAAANPWELLQRDSAAGIPAIADAETAQWILHKKLGDTVSVRDEAGAERKLQLVGLLRKSVFQGELLIGETAFQRLFPSRSGFNVFLIRAGAEDALKLQSELARGLADFGVTVESTQQRLASYARIANTYISAFQTLGGLGLLLGSFGLLVVLVRGALERRSELALLSAVGFSRASLTRLLLWENGGLLLCGLGLGAICGGLAAAPAWTQSHGQVLSVLLTVATFCAILLIILSVLASVSHYVVRGISPDALRRE